jgi:hypothetical protein
MTTTKVDSLFYESENYTRHGWYAVPIGDKEPPKGCTWTDKRGTIADVVYRQKYFCNNEDVKRLAIILDSIKFGFSLDVDGSKAMQIFQRKIIPRYSQGLQEKINRTTHTKTANGGYHWLFEIRRQDFPDGIFQKQYWKDRQNGGHGELKIIGTNQYVIERGIGYEQVTNRGIESLVGLSKNEVNEFLSVLDTFDRETKAILNVSNKLLKYYVRTNRQNLVLRIAGYLHKHKVPEYLTCELLFHMIEITGDEEPVQRKLAIRDTYVKDADTDQVSGLVKLLEAVDGDESVITTFNQEFGRLGYNFSNGNGNGNRSSPRPGPKQKSEEEEKKRFEYVQKYSNDILLAEAIIIEGKPCFAVVSKEDGRITLEVEIPLNDSKSTVLRAHDISSYINKPYSFASVGDFEDYLQRARNENLDSLYRKVKSIWKKYIDADDFHISLCAADTIFTYYQDTVGMTHYLFFIGDNDSGKSNNLVVLHFLAYRNMMSVGMSVANVYQFLGSRDEGVGTICEDEADDIDENHDKMQITKSGYTKGYPVTKIVITPYGRTQHKYNSYCFKAYTAERTPDPVKGKGFLQRIIKLQCSAGMPQHDILEVTNPAGDDKLQALLDELYDVRKLLFCHCRLLHHNDKILDIKLNLRNRENQLFKPVLKVFQGTKTFDELLPVLTKYVNEKRTEKFNSYHAYLYKIVGILLDDDFKRRGQNIIPLKSYNVWSFLKHDLEGSEILYKPLTFESADFGTLSQKKVTQTLIDVLGAKRPNRHGDSRMLLFDKAKFDRQRKLYDLDEIKITEEREQPPEGNGTDKTDGTDGTHSGGVGKDSKQSDDAENEETDKEITEYYEEKVIESNNKDEESTSDTPLHSDNVSHVSQVSQSLVICDCDLKNQEGADRFRAEVERLGKIKRNKVADDIAAEEDNLSGNGLLDRVNTT